MPPILPFWNAKGQVHRLEGERETFGDWSVGGEITDDRRSLLTRVEEAVQLAVVSTRVLGEGMSLTLEAFLSNGCGVIVRQLYDCSSTDPEEYVWRTRKFTNEAYLMTWLLRNTEVLVPRIHHAVHKSANSAHSFMIMQKLPGTVLFNTFGFFSSSIKEQVVVSFANIVLKLFRLPVPQRIGAIAPGISEGSLNVSPRLGNRGKDAATRVFDTLEEYIAFLFSLKRSLLSNRSSDDLRALSTLSDLESRVATILKQIDRPSFRRCVLVYEDLHERNILTDPAGHITGVIDWEIHCIQPAILAADYPQWLSYEGPNDPLFAAENTWWPTSREESRQLSEFFKDIVKSEDIEYFEALREGSKIWAVVAWLRDCHNDPGYDRLRAWIASVLQ